MALIATVLAPPPATAQTAGADAATNTPGRFDFYVLSLSWSPSYCAAMHRGRSDAQQCGARPYAFVVHGLWPQYERGFPEYCQDPAPRIDRALMASMLDLMPAPHLIYNEWDKHGTCSGLGARAYFDAVRKARAAVNVPPQYTSLDAPLTVTPSQVADAFVKANPSLPADGVAVECNGNRLSEVRICLAKDLTFRACPDVARRSCRRGQVVMPPVRGGNG